jgi:hypothetical protein
MKLFNYLKWKTIWTTDISVERRFNYLIFHIFCTLSYKVFIQIDIENKVCRCFITNGLSIYDMDIPKLIELHPEVIPVLNYYNIPNQ